MSTLQSMVLLLKAREGSPKRGYFWRSWMAVVSLTAMAKDLELHEHYDTHQMGKSCGSSAHDCVAKTRVWQMCLVYEAMIGGPQGMRICLQIRQHMLTRRQDAMITVFSWTPSTLTCHGISPVRTLQNTRSLANLSSISGLLRTSIFLR